MPSRLIWPVTKSSSSLAGRLTPTRRWRMASGKSFISGAMSSAARSRAASAMTTRMPASS